MSQVEIPIPKQQYVNHHHVCMKNPEKQCSTRVNVGLDEGWYIGNCVTCNKHIFVRKDKLREKATL